MNLGRKLFDFKGRSNRKEFWLFQLAFFLGSGSLGIFYGATGIVQFLVTLCGLAIVVSILSFQVRRLHDIGRTGWMVLIAFIPIIGPIILLFFYCKKGFPGENSYGPDPLLKSGDGMARV